MWKEENRVIIMEWNNQMRRNNEKKWYLPQASKHSTKKEFLSIFFFLLFRLNKTIPTSWKNRENIFLFCQKIKRRSSV